LTTSRTASLRSPAGRCQTMTRTMTMMRYLYLSSLEDFVERPIRRQIFKAEKRKFTG
jgi:hypothetical protein